VTEPSKVEMFKRSLMLLGALEQCACCFNIGPVADTSGLLGELPVLVPGVCCAVVAIVYVRCRASGMDPSVAEAVWMAQDASAQAQVVICEVVVPENSSMMTQSLLRTATMTLTSVGRHPHIPTLWDAFSEQGRISCLEPIEGETLLGDAAFRWSGADRA